MEYKPRRWQKKDDRELATNGRDKEYVGRVATNARNKIRRLACANFLETKDTFLTLTYKENMQDLERGAYDLKKFIQKMKRRVNGLKYLGVVEFQKRGAIHYHLLTNIPAKKNRWRQEKEIAELWEKGQIVKLKNIYNVDNLGAYLVKYMTKELADERLKGHKRYFFSRGNLLQPKILTGDELLRTLVTVEGNMVPIFTSKYNTEFHGECKYREYNYLRSEWLKDGTNC